MLWGGLTGLVIAAIMSAVGFNWILSTEANELRASKAEWGTPHVSLITDRGGLVPRNFTEPVQQVTVVDSYGATIKVLMYQTDSERHTANVWRNTRTGDSYVTGDIRYDRYGPREPYRIGDYGLLAAFLAVGSAVVIGTLLGFGIKRQERYVRSLRDQRESENSWENP